MKKHEGFKNLVYIFMKNNPNKRKSSYYTLIVNTWINSQYKISSRES